MKFLVLLSSLVLVACTTQPVVVPAPSQKPVSAELPILEAPEPKVIELAPPAFNATPGALRITTEAAPGDSSTYTINYELTGELRTAEQGGPDTVRVRLGRDSVAGKVTRVSTSRNRLTRTGNAVFTVNKIYGTAATYTACAQVAKNVVLNSKCISWTTNYPPRVLPPPTVDTVYADSSLALILTPADTTMTFASDSLGTAWLAAVPTWGAAVIPTTHCVFVQRRDGKYIMWRPQGTFTGCRRAYDKLPAAGRLPNYPNAVLIPTPSFRLERI